MEFNRFTYLYPPRPEAAIPPTMLAFYERRKALLQFKKNGTGNVMAISPDRDIIAMNRHREAHKLWAPDHLTRRAFMDLPGGWYYFVCELIHSKVKGMRHINYINDILVADSKSLVGTTFAQRQDILSRLFSNTVEHISGGYSVIDENTWLATNYESGFAELFERLSSDDRRKQFPEDEGVVLKDPKAKLAHCLKPSSNSSWQTKCRLPTKNYQF